MRSILCHTVVTIERGDVLNTPAKQRIEEWGDHGVAYSLCPGVVYPDVLEGKHIEAQRRAD